MSGLLHSPQLAAALAGDPIVLVDAGARGEPDPPWAGLGPDVLSIIGFEPDADECERLNARAPAGRRYLPIALWSQEGEIEVHIAATPSCSSVPAPNAELLARFAPAHVDPRRTTATVAYPARTLDSVLEAEGLRADVLKVDVQGAEGEVLIGAARALRSEIDVAIVETWTAEVHAGQLLTGDILGLARDAGLSLFDVSVAAAWGRRSTGDRDLGGKHQVVGLDLLLIRDPADWPAGAAPARRARAAAVAEAFGFPEVALELVNDQPALRDVLLAAGAERLRRRRDPRTRVGRLLGRGTPDFAPLHA
jgi:FkbM family methyltransferase